MTDLSLGKGLALMGGLLLLLLALQLWWVSRRARRVQAQSAASAEERVEPALGGEAGDAAADGAGGSLSGSDDAALASTPTLRTAAARRVPRLDALIDAMVPLALEAPISGELAVSHLPPSRRAGSKAFHVEGLDTETGEWEPLSHGRRYSELQAGVQMASRSGALNEIEYSEFMQKMQAYAEAVGASVDGAGAPDMLDVVSRARELDALAGPLDAQLAVTLRTNGVAWSVSFVQQVALRLGFVAGAVPGRLVLAAEDEGAPPVLVLAMDPQAALAEEPQASAIRECTLSLDVPQTPATREPFPAWLQAARQLAEELDAALVDDQGQSISLQAFAEIGQELDGLYGRLEALGLPAGSAAARRVFS